MLQGGLAQQQWRVSELLHRLLTYLEPKLTQVYKNVRERIGRYELTMALSLLCYIIVVKWVHLIRLCAMFRLFSSKPLYLPPSLSPFVTSHPLPSLSSVLTYIFMIDVALPHTHITYSPHVAEFLTRVLERLKPLMSEPEIHVLEKNTQETDERTQAVKLLKTGQNVDASM